MAYAKIIQRWSDGTELDVEVGCESPGYPDVLAELVAEAKVLWCDAVVETED